MTDRTTDPEQTPPPPPPPRDRLACVAKKIEGTSIFRFLRSIEPLLLAIALIPIGFGLLTLHEARAARFWELLLRQAGHGVGQVEALEYLNRPKPRVLPTWFPISFGKKTNFATIDLTPTGVADGDEEDPCYITDSLREVRNNLRGVRLPRAILDDANLKCTNLERAKLRRASLVKADLRHADLEEADLRAANLTQAELHDANLNGGRLRGARLRGAVLRKADLVGADLTESNLERAVLTDADLRHAVLDNAILSHADLTRATGLYCDQLRMAKNWEEAIRDNELACGGDVPPRIN